MRRAARLAVVALLASTRTTLLRRFILGVAVSACLVFPTTALAQKGSGSHGATAKSGGSMTTVHVKALSS